MENNKEKHMECPYKKDCKATIGFCHIWKDQITYRENGIVKMETIIYDCDRPLKKV